MNLRPPIVLTVKSRGGLMAIGQLNGHPMKFLIDTGAAVTLVSIENFRNFQNPVELDPFSHTICGADGRNLNTLGHGPMEITLGPMRVTHDIIVADIQADAILGVDFLSEYECTVDLSAQKLTVDSTQVNLWQEENVTIPFQAEKIVSGLLYRKGDEEPVAMIGQLCEEIWTFDLSYCG